MNHTLRTSAFVLAVLAALPAANAGTFSADFNTDPAAVITTLGNSIWRPSGGVTGGLTDGYLSITDAVNSQSGTIIFDDFDSGAIVTSFNFSCMLRTGGGTGDPADGYSVSFARETDPVVVNNNGSGFVLGVPEEGTSTGISVCLDEWFNGDIAGEVIGITVKVDGTVVHNTAMPTKNGSSTDTTSLQTGPAGVPVDGDFNVPGHTFVPLTVNVDPDGTLDVSFKGTALISNLATSYVPSRGRIVLAGRTGGANSHHHVDNISITTVAATVPLVNAASISPTVFNAVVTDSATSIIDTTKPITVTVDGNAIVVSVSKTGADTTLSFTQTPPALFTQGAHAVVITAKDTNGNTIVLTRSVTTPNYVTLDAAWKAAPLQVDTTTPSWIASIHRLPFGRTPGDANLLPLPERQIANGYYDIAIPGIAPNLADPLEVPVGTTAQPDGTFLVTGVVNWDQQAGAQGNFNAGNGFAETTIPGIPNADIENIAGELFTWIELPAGATTIGVNSDDGFTVSFGPTALDFFTRQVAGQFNGGRGASDTTFVVGAPVAGLYPMRVLWWEGGGGANVEIFTVDSAGVKTLVNDPVGVKAYSQGLPAKPSIHRIAPFPTAAFRCESQHPIQIDLVDGMATVVDASIILTVDGNVVVPTVTTAGLGTRIFLAPAGPGSRWTEGTHTVRLQFTDSTAGTRDETWTFISDAPSYIWKRGGTDVNNILDPTNWVGNEVPPNDGTHINLPAGFRIRPLDNVDVGGRDVPNDSGREIRVAAGGQIFSDKGDFNIAATTIIAGTGTDGNGVFYNETGGWLKPQNVILSGDATITANGGRYRMDTGANRLDLAGFTKTHKGNNEVGYVNTTIVGTAGSRLIHQTFTAYEGVTKVDPNVTVEMAPNMTLSSWDGRANRREHATVLRNGASLETRQQDLDLTFTGPVTVNAGDTGILRAQIQATGQNGDGTDQRLVVTGDISGAGGIRKDGNGTLVLSGNNTQAGGTTLTNAGTVVASDTALGAGPVTSTGAATVHFTNGGSPEYRDADSRDAALGGATGFSPVLAGLHAVQAFDNTRFSYSGKISNPTGAPLLVTFAEQYDDDVYLTVDDQVLINDTRWDGVTTAQVTLSPGEHDIRVSVRNGGGGAGPNNGWEWSDTGGDLQKGVGWSIALPEGGATTNSQDYTRLGANFEVYQPVHRTVANNFVLNAGTTLTSQFMNGYDATVTGIISGGAGLTIGGDTLYRTDDVILTAANTYTGGTTVNSGGSLVVNGNNSAANGAVTVASGGSLGGTGTVGGVTVVDGSVSPGSNGPGILSIAQNTTWNAGNSWYYDLGVNSDRLNITGDFIKGSGGPFVFDFNGTAICGPGTYTLVSWTGSTGFVAGDFSAANLGYGGSASFSIVGNELRVAITRTPYAAWLCAAFTVATTPAADMLPGADPDDDGLNNVAEYGLGTSPTTKNGAPEPAVVTVGADKYLSVSWTRPAGQTDLTTIGEVSDDLQPALDWVSGAGDVITTITPAGATETVMIRDAQPIGTSSRRFIRGRFTLTP